MSSIRNIVKGPGLILLARTWLAGSMNLQTPGSQMNWGAMLETVDDCDYAEEQPCACSALIHACEHVHAFEALGKYHAVALRLSKLLTVHVRPSQQLATNSGHKRMLSSGRMHRHASAEPGPT